MIFEFLKQWRRRRLQVRPFPKEWLTLIQRHVVFFHKLSVGDRAELLGNIHVFLAEKRFEGCGGFAVTDEGCVAIAGAGFFFFFYCRAGYFSRLLTIFFFSFT